MAAQAHNPSENEAVEKPVRVVGIVPTPHGGLFALKEDGTIWERRVDPAPRSTPGPAGFVWVKIEGP